jgi:glucose-6-phosphate 1-dehydrogenase
VAPDSQVETFAAVRLSLDTWRWADVPFYIRAGKDLPVTTTEILVELKRPPQAVFEEGGLPQSNYFRFRLSPDVMISLGARAKVPGEAMRGEAVELVARHHPGDEMQPTSGFSEMPCGATRCFSCARTPLRRRGRS